MEYYTVSELAAKAGQSAAYIRRLCQNGTITAEKKGRDWLIPKWAGDSYLESIAGG